MSRPQTTATTDFIFAPAFLQEVRMNRSVRDLIVLSVCCLAGTVVIRAQVPPVAAPGDATTASMSARQMFEEADSYANNKQAELEKQKTKVDERVKTKLRQEQRDLAAKFVASLRGRDVQVGEDLY